MKQLSKNTFLIILLSLLLTETAFSQNLSSKIDFTLSGIFHGSQSPILHIYYMGINDKVVSDSCKVVNGHFSFTGHLKNGEPAEAVIEGNVKSNDMDDPNRASIFIEPNDMNIDIYENEFKKLKLTGSEMQQEADSLNTIEESINFKREKLTKLANTLYHLKKDSVSQSPSSLNLDSIVLLREIYNNKIDSIELAFIKNNKSSYLSAYLLAFIESKLPTDSLRFLFYSLNYPLQNSRYGLEIKNTLKRRIQGELKVGEPAHNFVAVNLKGGIVNLSSFRNKNFVLLDFWASWCSPCRKENTQIIKIYNQYHKKGLKIIGVSLDYNAESWKKAVIADGIDDWDNILVSKNLTNELSIGNYDTSSIVNKYYISTIPKLILIDREGIIRKIYSADNDGKVIINDLNVMLNKN